jgi:hypothetical protein
MRAEITEGIKGFTGNTVPNWEYQNCEGDKEKKEANQWQETIVSNNYEL